MRRLTGAKCRRQTCFRTLFARPTDWPKLRSSPPLRTPVLPSFHIRPYGRPMSICHITRRHPAAHRWRRVHHGASNKADNIATGYANLSLLALLAQTQQVAWRQLVVTCIDQGKRVATPIVAIATLATTSMVVLVVLGMRLATVQRNNTKNVERMVNCNAPNFGAGQP